MAFGGVATGNINAKEVAIVIGITNIRGEILRACATLIMIGINRVAVAVLDINSVRNTTIVITISSITHHSNPFNDSNTVTK